MRIDLTRPEVDGPATLLATVKDIDFETTQNIDIQLPSGYRYAVVEALACPRTSPSVITTKPRLGFSKVVAGVAAALRGTCALHASSVDAVDNLLEYSGAGCGYLYLQNVVAASSAGIITQVTNLTAAGTASVIAQPDVPRKLRIVVADNADGDLVGTVTVVGYTSGCEKVTEVVSVPAGTLTVDTVNAFASVSAITYDFSAASGGTGAALDTLNVGQDTSLGLPSPYTEVAKLVSNGTEESPGASDVSAGTFDPTTAPNGTNDYEVWYRGKSAAFAISGEDVLRLVVTGGTVTGEDLRDVILTLRRW